MVARIDFLRLLLEVGVFVLGHAEGAQAAQQLVKERHWFPGRLGCPGAPAATATTLWTASKDSTHRRGHRQRAFNMRAVLPQLAVSTSVCALRDQVGAAALLNTIRVD